jgi:CRP-like cAMP-binding protein
MSQHRPGAQYGASFLSLLRTEERQRLIDAGTVRQVAEGTQIYVQDRPSTKIVILLTAYARVLRDGAWVAYRGPGDILGELSLIDGQPHSATVQIVRAGRVAVLSHEAFDRVMRRHDGVRNALLRVLVHRLRCADLNGDGRTERTVVRVARLLERTRRGDGAPFRYQHQIAEMLGVARSSVVRALGRLRERGIVTTGHGTIEVVSFERLAAFLAEVDGAGPGPPEPGG